MQLMKYSDKDPLDLSADSVTLTLTNMVSSDTFTRLFNTKHDY